MALLDKLTFLGKFNSAVSGLFKANGTQAITSAQLRTLVTDTLDSMLHEYDNSVLRDCGNADLSGGLWPTAGGKGESGAILKNNFFRVSVAGTPTGASEPIHVGMWIVAKQDSPTTKAHWDVITAIL
jgi:hypothetical protein